MTDRPAEAASNARWQATADEPWDDRPGIVASLRRYGVIVVAAMLLGALAGYRVAQLTPFRYEAEAMLILSDPGGPDFLRNGSLSSSDREVYLAKQANIMTSSAVLARAIKQLGRRQSISEVRDELTVQPSADMASISIVATGSDPRSAAALANAVGSAFEKVTAERASQDAARAIESIRKLRARREADLDASPTSPDGSPTARQQQLSNQIDDLVQREQDISTQLATYASGVELFERATPPTSPAQPKPKQSAMLGALLGLIGAGAWAWWAAARNQRAERRGDPARILEAPLLGEVPELRVSRMLAGKPVTLPPALEPSAADAYDFVVASLMHELAGVGGRSVAMTNVGPGDWRTSVTLNIANAAWKDLRILVIDADERTQRLSELYGLSEVLDEGNGHLLSAPQDESVDDYYIRRLVYTGSAMVLPIKPNGTDPEHPFGSHRVPDIHKAVLAVGPLFELVLIDTPAVLAASDSLSVAGQTDGIVLVVPHRVSLGELRDVRDRLAFVKTPLIGYIYVRPRGLVFRARRRHGRRRVGKGAGY